MRTPCSNPACGHVDDSDHPCGHICPQPRAETRCRCQVPSIRAEALRLAPTYMAAADALMHAGVPDVPADECWTCRVLRAAGHDPMALVAADCDEHGLFRAEVVP